MNAIELKKIIGDKRPMLARLLPGFVVGWLGSVVCLRRVNHILTTFGGSEPLSFISQTLDYIGVTYSVHYSEPLTDGRRVIFAANHPLGGLDGLILALALGGEKGSEGGVKLIVNDLLMNLEPLRPIFVPVNKHGRQASAAAQAHDAMYSSDCQVITFPAGLCSRLIGGEITDPRWRNTVVQKALRYDREVVPVFIDGVNSRGFYRFARWRKRLCIPVNLEMILLPSEMFAQRGRHINIYIGSPVRVDKSRSTEDWTAAIRRKCYEFRD